MQIPNRQGLSSARGLYYGWKSSICTTKEIKCLDWSSIWVWKAETGVWCMCGVCVWCMCVMYVGWISVAKRSDRSIDRSWAHVISLVQLKSLRAGAKKYKERCRVEENRLLNQDEQESQARIGSLCDQHDEWTNHPIQLPLPIAFTSRLYHQQNIAIVVSNKMDSLSWFLSSSAIEQSSQTSRKSRES